MHDTAPKDTLLNDRRGGMRRPCRVQRLTIEHSETGMHECQVVDISRTGLRLQMPICLPCGCEVLIHPPHDSDLRISRARIVRQRVVDRADGTWFECGLHYTEKADVRRHSWFLALRASDVELEAAA